MYKRQLWNLLSRYRIPTFIFVNKMDQPGTDKTLILKELKKKLDASCVDMEDPEDIATGDERALEEYLEAGEVSIDTISQMIADRQIFPCYFGAALKLQGVQELLDGIGKYVGDNVSVSYTHLVVITLSGRGDKDCAAIVRYRGEDIHE